MQSLTKANFGVVIEYLIPGFIALFGLSFQSPTVRAWLLGHESVTIGGFLYSTLTALIIGLLCSTARWLCLDLMHHKTGIAKPHWDFAQLQKNLGAYTLLEENHYRYYQFYGNSLFAWVIGYGCWRHAETKSLFLLADVGFAVVVLMLYLGSRDTLRKYYQRVRILLSSESTGLITSPLNLPKNLAERNAKCVR